MNDIILTVCIPTYNRPEQIQDQVRSVIKQLRPNVKLVVRDNCSDVPISSLFTDEEMDSFTIFRNNVNIGADANIARCLETSGDSWVWTLGDDDVICDNAVDTILDTISSHRDCCYINFSSKVNNYTLNFENLLKHWEIIGEFGTSFFMSACVFNMSKLKTSIRWYYEFLSSQMGQICFVVKHVENNPLEKCFFTKKRIILFNAPGGWNPINLIINSSIIIDKLQYNHSKFKNNIFASLSHIYLSSIVEHDMSVSDKVYYLNFIRKKIGLINLFRYNSLSLMQVISKLLLPNSVYKRLKRNISNKYKRKIQK